VTDLKSVPLTAVKTVLLPDVPASATAPKSELRRAA
jgi:hypothetical protein